MNRIYKLVLFVEISARSGSVLSMSVKINVITDINIFVQAHSVLGRPSPAAVLRLVPGRVGEAGQQAPALGAAESPVL